MPTKKYVYFFGRGRAEGSAKMKDLLGGKGSNLAEMTNLKIPVPPGFTITTEACVLSMKRAGKFPPGMWKQVEKNLRNLEKAMDLTFGDRNAPLLVSVRSGARVSMPGMMDTVLNLGLNDDAIEGFADLSGNPRFAYDSYRRFIQMFSNVVLGISTKNFEEILEHRKREVRVELDTDLAAPDLQEIVRRYKSLVRERIGREFPQDPRQQLQMAVGPSSGRGITRGPSSIGRSTACPIPGERRSTCRPWSLAIWGNAPGPGSHLPGIRARDRSASMESS